jgi:SH3-like domain-containing protein
MPNIEYNLTQYMQRHKSTICATMCSTTCGFKKCFDAGNVEIQGEKNWIKSTEIAGASNSNLFTANK